MSHYIDWFRKLTEKESFQSSAVWKLWGTRTISSLSPDFGQRYDPYESLAKWDNSQAKARRTKRIVYCAVAALIVICFCVIGTYVILEGVYGAKTRSVVWLGNISITMSVLMLVAIMATATFSMKRIDYVPEGAREPEARIEHFNYWYSELMGAFKQTEDFVLDIQDPELLKVVANESDEARAFHAADLEQELWSMGRVDSGKIKKKADQADKAKDESMSCHAIFLKNGLVTKPYASFWQKFEAIKSAQAQ